MGPRALGFALTLIAVNLGEATSFAAAGPAGSQESRPVGWTGRDCAECPEITVVPAGKFTMGAAETEAGSQSSERPQHSVTIPGPLAISTRDITFAEWEACAAAGGCKSNKRPDDNGWGRGDRPVINVSWEDVQHYVRWLSERTGKAYRLLTEAEWEYAARAGTDTAFYWGNDAGEGNANCAICGSRWRLQTSPVGSFKPNPFGLFDMSGNVFQWVEDCWSATYDGAPSDGSARQKDNCSQRVVRGGAWYGEPDMLRSAFRSKQVFVRRSYDVGFRVARTL